MRPIPTTFRLPWLPAFGAAALLCVLGVAGFVHLRSQQRRFREQVEAQLLGVADLRSRSRPTPSSRA